MLPLFSISAAVALTSNLEERLGLQLPPTLVFDHPSASAITAFLQESGLGSTTTTTVPASAADTTSPTSAPAYGIPTAAHAQPLVQPAHMGVQALVQAAVQEALGTGPEQAVPVDAPLMQLGVNSTAGLCSSLLSAFNFPVLTKPPPVSC